MNFQNIEWLNLFWILIPLGFCYFTYLKWRTNVLNTHFDSSLGQKIFPFDSKINRHCKVILQFIIIVLLIFAIANPLANVKAEKVKGKGIDIMILLDVSNSMLAQDIQPNRLERSKLFIGKLIDKLPKDRIGLIIFAGNAFTQVPITIDHPTIKMNLSVIEPSSIARQGTNIGEAIQVAEKTLGLTDTKNKCILILTDGEDQDDEANTAIESAKDNGIQVLAIGVGEEEGAPIPMGGDYKRDESGNIIKTAFNKSMLQDLASIGDGAFYHLSQQTDITDAVVSAIERIEQKEYTEQDFSTYESYYYWVLLVALICIVVAYFIPHITYKAFLSRVLGIIILNLFFISLSAQKITETNYSQAISYIRKGNTAFLAQNYSEAEILYLKSLNIDSFNPIARFNLANTLYQMNRNEEAIAEYLNCIRKLQDKKLKAKAYYNLGSAYYKLKNTERSIYAYEQSLMFDPTDQDAKYNLALLKRKKKQEEKQKEQEKKKKEQEQNKPNQKPNPEKKEDPKEQEKKENSKPESEPQEERPSKSKMTKEQVEQLLEALKNQEQMTQRRLQKQKELPPMPKSGKDW